MGGPTEQKTDSVFIPPGEGRQVFSPEPLAWLVENFETGIDGILRSVVGPSILRIKPQVFVTQDQKYEDIELDLTDSALSEFPVSMCKTGYKSGSPQSIYSADLFGGSANMLLYRIGSRLYSFKGSYTDADEVLISDLTVSLTPETLDQYVTINDKIVYFNGQDRPQVITYDGRVTPLGFSKAATVPSISSPGQPTEDTKLRYYPNSQGYSWKGRVGTPGDELVGSRGALLKGQWYYYIQYEDINGNLSEVSSVSEPATLHTNQTDPIKTITVGPLDAGQSSDEGNRALFTWDGNRVTSGSVPDGSEMDDLTRRFLVKSSGSAPEHTVAVRIYRTPDTLHSDGTPRFLTRVPGASQFFFDDNISDFELGDPMPDTISVPVFRVACAHKGRLVIANLPGNPGIVRQSQPGFPGTFERSEFLFPDTNGDAITALASYNGQLVAFTEKSTYLIGDDFANVATLSTSVGCVAPKSVQSFGGGNLVWLGPDGFYALSPDGRVVKISDSLDKVFRDEVNHSRMKFAVSTVDKDAREYRCCLAMSGSWENKMMLCFDGKYWRRQTLGIHIADLCALKDYTHYTVAVGSDPRERNLFFTGSGTVVSTGASATVRTRGDVSRVFVLNRQSTDYFGPSRRIRYRSNWLRSSDLGLVPTHVRSLYIGMLDAWAGVATVRIYRNGSWDPYLVMEDLLLSGPDDGSGIVVDQAGQAVVGKAKARTPRVFWRQIPVGIENANSWAFEVEIVGSPAPEPYSDKSGSTAPIPGDEVKTFAASEREIWQDLYRSRERGGEAFDAAIQSPHSWELGRMRIFGFAFDVSVATKGSPLGRVPHRKDT